MAWRGRTDRDLWDLTVTGLTCDRCEPQQSRAFSVSRIPFKSCRSPCVRRWAIIYHCRILPTTKKFRDDMKCYSKSLSAEVPDCFACRPHSRRCCLSPLCGLLELYA